MVAIAIASVPHAAAAQPAAAPGASGTKAPGARPVPRFVSLKSDRVNLRQGPSKEHQVTWVFSRAGLPVEVTAEFDNWRRVRDSEGAEGWVYYSLLSGRRTALVIPWDRGKSAAVPLRKDKGSDKIVAQLQPGVLGNVDRCDGEWCKLDVDGYSGWIPQVKLWGVYRGEVVK